MADPYLQLYLPIWGLAHLQEVVQKAFVVLQQRLLHLLHGPHCLAVHDLLVVGTGSNLVP